MDKKCYYPTLGKNFNFENMLYFKNPEFNGKMNATINSTWIVIDNLVLRYTGLIWAYLQEYTKTE